MLSSIIREVKILMSQEIAVYAGYVRKDSCNPFHKSEYGSFSAVRRSDSLKHRIKLAILHFIGRN